MKRFVLDASAGVELLLNTARARSLSAQFPLSAQWWVPEHYFVEVAGALRRAALNNTVGFETTSTLPQTAGWLARDVPGDVVSRGTRHLCRGGTPPAMGRL